MNPIEINTYISPIKTEEVWQNILREGVINCRYGYKKRSEILEILVTKINKIVQHAVGTTNEKETLSAGFQNYKKFFEDGGSKALVYDVEMEAYEYLNSAKNFNSNTLNSELVNNTIENFKRKASECRAAEILFSNIEADNIFQINPCKYVEDWRNSITILTVEQRKVFKCFNIIKIREDPYFIVNYRIIGKFF